MKIDDALVDAHLEPVPRLGALTARGLARGDAQRLGRHADRAADLERLLLGAADELGAHCREQNNETIQSLAYHNLKYHYPSMRRQKISWRVQKRHRERQAGLALLFQETPIIIPRKQQFEPRDAFKNTL